MSNGLCVPYGGVLDTEVASNGQGLVSGVRNLFTS